MPSRVTKHFLETSFVLLIGLVVSCISIWPILAGHIGDWDNFFLQIMASMIGICVAVPSLSVLCSYRGSLIFENVLFFSQSDSTAIEIGSPATLNGGRVFVYLPKSADIYHGQISLCLRQRSGQFDLGKVILTKTKPSYRIPIPKWLKVLHVQEAGTTLDLWPRGTGRSFNPVVIPFNRTVCAGDVLLLKLEVQNIFVEEKARASGITPIADLVTILLKT